MTKKKIFLHAAYAAGCIGLACALWAMIHIVQYPAFESATPADSFKFCLGFGLVAIGICGIILLSPRSDNKLSRGIGNVIASIVGFEGTLLVICAIVFLR